MSSDVPPGVCPPEVEYSQTEQARDLARWSRGELKRLRAEPQAIYGEDRRATGAALAGHLDDFLDARLDGARGLKLSAY